MIRLLIAVACLAGLILAAPETYDVPRLDGRIVGGEPTFVEEYPYQVSLQLYAVHTCGAVVIDRAHVVTAGHCTDEPAEYYSVRAGTTFHNGGGVVINVSAIYRHPNYSRPNLDYDISVLRLVSLLYYGSAIAPVALPELNQPIIAGSISQVSGWGTLTENGVAPTRLHVVEVPVVSLEDCRAAYGADAVTDRQMCAGLPEGGKDACQGDSGSPLVVNRTLIGLVSWGRGCARPIYPGVYSNVPVLRDFIRDVTGL